MSPRNTFRSSGAINCRPAGSLYKHFIPTGLTWCLRNFVRKQVSTDLLHKGRHRDTERTTTLGYYSAKVTLRLLLTVSYDEVL